MSANHELQAGLANDDKRPEGQTYHVISPDGFPITHEPFVSIEEALAYIPEWCKRYEAQGYYSAVGRRIPLEDLPDHLRLVPSEEVIC